MISEILVTVENGVSVVMSDRQKQYVDFFMNATIMQQLLGGSAVLLDPLETNMAMLLSLTAQMQPLVNGGNLSMQNFSFKYNLTLIWENATLGSQYLSGDNLTKYLNTINPPRSNKMFIDDAATDTPSSAAARGPVFIVNALLLGSLLAVFCTV